MTNQLNKGDIIRVHGQCFPYPDFSPVCTACGKGWTDFEIIGSATYESRYAISSYNCISLSTSQESKEFNLKFHPKIGWFHTNAETVTGLTVTKVIGYYWTRKPKLKE